MATKKRARKRSRRATTEREGTVSEEQDLDNEDFTDTYAFNAAMPPMNPYAQGFYGPGQIIGDFTRLGFAATQASTELLVGTSNVFANLLVNTLGSFMGGWGLMWGGDGYGYSGYAPPQTPSSFTSRRATTASARRGYAAGQGFGYYPGYTSSFGMVPPMWNPYVSASQAIREEANVMARAANRFASLYQDPVFPEQQHELRAERAALLEAEAESRARRARRAAREAEDQAESARRAKEKEEKEVENT